jgi:chlorobactene glucosyltransferase
VTGAGRPRRSRLALPARVAAWLWAGAAALALHERRAAPRPEDEPPVREGPPVSVIVPARDEERGVGAGVRSLRALEYRPLEVIVVDDESRDATGAAARAAADGDRRVRVIAGEPLPAGWIGKPWACWQGARAARGEWLLFTDADVFHSPDSLGRTLALGLRLGRGGVTLFPTIEAEGAAERMVIPAAAAAIGAFVAPGPLSRSPRSPVAIAAGGYLLIERGLYDRVGGHAAIRGRMVDDVALAARVKRAGGLLVPAPAGDLARVRIYHGAREVWQGWSKNASFGVEGGAAKALVGGTTVGVLAVVPLAAALEGLRRRDRGLAAAGVAGTASLLALQRVTTWAVPTPPWYATTMPLGMAVMSAAAIRGALDRLAGRGPRWRGRRYPLAR